MESKQKIKMTGKRSPFSTQVDEGLQQWLRDQQRDNGVTIAFTVERALCDIAVKQGFEFEGTKK